MFHNPSKTAITTTAMYNTQLGSGTCNGVLTDHAAPAGVALGKKDTGIMAYSANTRQQTVLFHLAGARSKVKPAISNNSNAHFVFAYTLNVPPGKTVSVLHGLAQRRLGTPPDAKAAAALFKFFSERDWVRDVPRDVRRTIVNLGGIGFGGWDFSGGMISLESLGVERQATDVLAVGEMTRLHGTASCSRLSVESRYGTKEIPFEKVAAVVGLKHPSRKSRLFLRDGQVIAGKIATEGLHFTMNTGMEMDLAADKLDRLVLHAAAEDGKRQTDVVVMLHTVDGDCLALVRGDEQTVTATTPWGEREVSLEGVQRLAAAEEGVGHLLVLRDGSQLFAFMHGLGLTFSTHTFGRQTFSPIQIRAMAAAHLKNDDEDDQAQEITVPHVMLAGDNVLVGKVDLAALHFVTPGAKIPVPPEQIRTLRNINADEEWSPGKQPLFEAELWDGGTISGRLSELVLPIRTTDRVSRVPVYDVVEIHVPTPTVPDTMRTKIAQLIRDLGHPEFTKRDAASEALAEMGHLPKLQLDETLRLTSDPEVRRRVEALLAELPD